MTATINIFLILSVDDLHALIAANLYQIDATVSFKQHIYNIKEDDERIEVVLILSNPSSTAITVEVFGTDESATGK